ncbi:glycoside hydrolase family 130 protein [Hephaestia sp. CMS5P-6]|nr:glycoside hydrolase family 130 protein [Hephaestia mangrovi]
MVRHLPLTVPPDPSRVVLRPFTPADNPFADTPAHRSRVAEVVDRVLALPEPALEARLERVVASLADRHDDVALVLDRRCHDVIAPNGGPPLSAAQARLVGAYFTEEYSLEAAALFNPSIVPHPDQSAVPAGATRIVLSQRGVGEGHVSSITFRTGLVAPDGNVTLDPVSPRTISPRIEALPGAAPDDPGTRLFYGDAADLSAVVIFPVTLRQRHGVEDLRLTLFTEDDGTQSYIGTYTAFSGEAIRQELLRTRHFASIELSVLQGPLAATKGMALFPRRIGGYYAMLGRQDHENIWLLRSNDLYRWDHGAVIVRPRWPWEFVQIGNCGAPIELDEGWLAVTHGVGPVRNYCLGACLLDKRDPSRLLARTSEPLIAPETSSRGGYVPNVVYSCGALAAGRRLVLPYGVADSFTAFAVIDIDRLLAAMD